MEGLCNEVSQSGGICPVLFYPVSQHLLLLLLVKKIKLKNLHIYISISISILCWELPLLYFSPLFVLWVPAAAAVPEIK